MEFWRFNKIKKVKNPGNAEKNLNLRKILEFKIFHKLNKNPEFKINPGKFQFNFFYSEKIF